MLTSLLTCLPSVQKLHHLAAGALTAVYRVFKVPGAALSILQRVFHFTFTVIPFGRLFLSVTRRRRAEPGEAE